MNLLLLAQDLPVNPAKVAQDLAKAQSVQEVLAWVVGVLLLAIVAVVVYHVKREHYHEESLKAIVDKIAASSDASNDREDKLRLHYEDRLDREREEQKAIMRELNETLKGYAEE